MLNKDNEQGEIPVVGFEGGGVLPLVLTEILRCIWLGLTCSGGHKVTGHHGQI